MNYEYELIYAICSRTLIIRTNWEINPFRQAVFRL